jgi:hypothetical protein
MKLIYVHGRNQQGKDKEALRTEWRQAQAEGFKGIGYPWPGGQEGIEPVLPFYGDELDKLVKQLNSPLAADVIARGGEEASAKDDESALRSELLEEIAQAQNITAQQIAAQFATDIVARGGDAGAIERGIGNWEWVHSILKLLDRTPLGATAIDAFTRDVSVYLTNDTVQQRIDDIVRAAIPDEPCMVIAHSLGTVVAYNVLRALPPGAPIRFVTVGSPLGIQSIKRHLATPLVMPRRVVQWYNAMDEQDIVALYPLDRNRFGIVPAIENKTTVDNQTGEHHGIVGYLQDTDVARVCYLGLTVV